MKILSIDTTNINCDVSVSDDNTLLSQNSTISEQSHSQNLLPVIQGALSNSKLSISDIDLVVANIGPGSFTGIRVGIATALSFIDSFSINSIGVNSLELLAYTAKKENSVICSVLPSNNDAFYYSVYKTDSDGIPITVLLDPTCGSYSSLIHDLDNFPDSNVILHSQLSGIDFEHEHEFVDINSVNLRELRIY